MYGRSDVNVKVERGSTFTFTRDFSYIVSILFTHVKPVKSLRPYARKNYATVEIHLYAKAQAYFRVMFVFKCLAS